MTEPKPRPRRVVQLNNDPCPLDPEVFERGVQAIEALAKTAEDLKPAAEAVVYLKEAEEKLCSWFKTRGPWMVAAIALVWSTLGKISPELAEAALKVALSHLGG